MSTRVAFRIAWSLCAFDIVVIAALYVVNPVPEGFVSSLAGVVFIVTSATTGALVASKLPANPIGWLMCVGALAFTLGGVSVEIVEQSAQQNQDLPLTALAAWVGGFVWMIGLGLSCTFLLLLFPDGRLPSRRWRPVTWLAGAAMTLAIVGPALSPGRIGDTHVTNPLGIRGARIALESASEVGVVLLLVAILASCASLVVRFLAAGREQRQQLKWIAYSLPLVVSGFAVSIWIESAYTSDMAIELANILTLVALMVLPLAIGIAILRHRLYDIDVVINRTLVYGTLTATLAATYLGAVLLLQLALSPLTQGSGLAIAGSTLAVAALFRPARRRIQSAVDRRFYRRRYDAARTLEAFAVRLRQEFDLDAMGADLSTVVRETVQPSHVSIWLRGGS